MIESFWKKYWFEMLVSIGFFVGGIIFLCIGKELAAITYFVFPHRKGSGGSPGHRYRSYSQDQSHR